MGPPLREGVPGWVLFYKVFVVAFKLLDRNQAVPLPATVCDFVPENHLARFVVFVVGLLDLSPITDNCKGSGKPTYSMLLSLILDGQLKGLLTAGLWRI
jgi:hypothetical protein